MLPLLRGHRHDDGLDALERIIVDVHVLDGLAHARYHGSQVLDVAHLLDLLDLVVEVHESELVLGKLLLQLAGLLLIILLLGLLHEGYHIAHAEDSVGDTVRVEDIEGLRLLARAHELDRLADHSLD